MSDGALSADASLPLAICVPVRNEVARLSPFFETLDGLSVPSGVTVRLCLLLDSCTDGSAELATRHASQARHPLHLAAIRQSAANAGVARHAAMLLGMRALEGADGILMTTDADSWPRADWIAATIAALAGADVVAGNVIRRRRGNDKAQDRIDRYYDRLHALRRRVDPVAWEAQATHHRASGANMAMRVRTYAALGGFAPLPSGEDARLLDDAARAGFRVRRDADSVVHTSSRRDGRARGGLATALDMLDRFGLDGVRVAHPVDQLWQYRHHALARHAFSMGELPAFAAALDLSTDHVRGVARDCPNAEAFAMRIVPEAPGGMRHVPLAAAERALTALAGGIAPARAA